MIIHYSFAQGRIAMLFVEESIQFRMLLKLDTLHADAG